jgi:hypothetical protein
MTGLNRHHSRTLLAQLVGYLAVPIEKLPAEAVPMDQASKIAHPTAVVPRHWLLPLHSRPLAAVDSDLVCPNQQLIAVEQGFALPMDFVAVEQASDPNQGFAVVETGSVFPSPPVVEQASDPNQGFAVVETGSVFPSPPVVEQASVDPILMVAAVRSMH